MSWTEVISTGGSSSELSSPLEPTNKQTATVTGYISVSSSVVTEQ